RDYVYIPLGGNRVGNSERSRYWLTNRNLLITMTLGGLWHGAAWSFVIWGVLHGLFLIIHRSFRSFCEQHRILNRLLGTLPGVVLGVGMTFLCVCLAWVFFRATTFGGALVILNHLLAWHVGQPAPLTCHSWATLGGVLLLCHLLMYRGVW